MALTAPHVPSRHPQPLVTPRGLSTLVFSGKHHTSQISHEQVGLTPIQYYIYLTLKQYCLYLTLIQDYIYDLHHPRNAEMRRFSCLPARKRFDAEEKRSKRLIPHPAQGSPAPAMLPHNRIHPAGNCSVPLGIAPNPLECLMGKLRHGGVLEKTRSSMGRSAPCCAE